MSHQHANVIDINNKTLYRAQEIYTTSENKLRSSSKTLERTHSINHKLKIVQTEVSSLFASAKRMWEGVQVHANSLLQEIIQTIETQNYYCNELKSSLDKLKGISIHNSLKQSIMDSLSALHSSFSIQDSQSSLIKSKDTLYDFVNIKSINDLLESSVDKIKDLENLKSVGETYLEQSKEKFDNIKQKIETLQSHLKKDTLKSISSESNFQSIEDNSHIKKLNRIYSSMVEEQNNLLKYINDQSQNIENRFIQDILIRLEDLLNRMEQEEAIISNKCLLVEEQYQNGTKFYNEVIETLDAVESFIPEMKKRFSQYDNLSNMLDEWKNKPEVNQLYKEICDLTTWYKFFPIAYDSLLLELHRRQEIIVQHQKRIQEMQEELYKMYETENEKRQEFFEEFGQYLPSTIFPGVLEETPSFKIQSTEKRNFRTTSINLSEEEIEKIRIRLEQAQLNSPKNEDKSSSINTNEKIE